MLGTYLAKRVRDGLGFFELDGIGSSFFFFFFLFFRGDNLYYFSYVMPLVEWLK